MTKVVRLAIVFIFCISSSKGQPNCNVYLWKGDTLCYKACLEATEAGEYEQGSKASQIHFDKAIQYCPTFAYAYFEKAVPYLKRGDFITWKQLIDKAVELSPTAYLGYRAWCRYQFLRDYEGAIRDIDRLDSLITYDIGHSINGDYHLNIAKALCYKALGEKKKAIEIIEQHLSSASNPSNYDYLHLGVLKLETGDYTGAVADLKKEIEINDCLSETYYYLALAYKKCSDQAAYAKNLLKAKDFYESGKKRTDPYTEPIDKIYLIDIENEIKTGW